MPAVLVAAGIAVLSLMEIHQPSAMHVNDKLMHGIFYFFLSVALMSGLARDGYRSWKWAMLAFLASTAYGALIEVLQRFCTLTRSGEMADLYADAIGALIGTAIIWLITILNSKS